MDGGAGAAACVTIGAPTGDTSHPPCGGGIGGGVDGRVALGSQPASVRTTASANRKPMASICTRCAVLAEDRGRRRCRAIGYNPSHEGWCKGLRGRGAGVDRGQRVRPEAGVRVRRAGRRNAARERGRGRVPVGGSRPVPGAARRRNDDGVPAAGRNAAPCLPRLRRFRPRVRLFPAQVPATRPARRPGRDSRRAPTRRRRPRLAACNAWGAACTPTRSASASTCASGALCRILTSFRRRRGGAALPGPLRCAPTDAPESRPWWGRRAAGRRPAATASTRPERAGVRPSRVAERGRKSCSSLRLDLAELRLK